MPGFVRLIRRRPSPRGLSPTGSTRAGLSSQVAGRLSARVTSSVIEALAGWNTWSNVKVTVAPLGNWGPLAEREIEMTTGKVTVSAGRPDTEVSHIDAALEGSSSAKAVPVDARTEKAASIAASRVERRRIGGHPSRTLYPGPPLDGRWMLGQRRFALRHPGTELPSAHPAEYRPAPT